MIGYRVFSPKRAWSVITTMFMRHASKQRSRRKVEKQFPHKHAVMQPVAVRKESLGQRCLIWQRAACRLAATVSFHSLANIGSSLRRETDHANCKMNKNPECSVNEGANRRKGELRASSPFPLGGYSALPRTGGIPQLLEARPHEQAMPAHLRVRHLDLATRRQQALILSISNFAGLDRLMMKTSEAEAGSHNGIGSATMKPAAACDCNSRQHRLIWVGAAYRLAVAALLPPLTYVASSLGYELDRFVQELDDQGHQTQKSIQPVHRQLTSSQRRRRCRLAGLTPLTYRYYSSSSTIIQTYVRILNAESIFSAIRACRISCWRVAYKKAGENVPGTWRPLRKENHLLYITRRSGHSLNYTCVRHTCRKAA